MAAKPPSPDAPDVSGASDGVDCASPPGRRSPSAAAQGHLQLLLQAFERSIEADRLNWAVLDFFDRSPVTFWIKAVEADGTLRVIRVNAAYERIVGVDRSTVVGRQDREAWGDAVADEVEGHDRQVIAGGEPIAVVECVNGRCWRVSKWPIKDGDGTVIAVAGMAEPIDE